MENFRLKVFRGVAKHLNFRRAAEELCLTQPAVTLQIKTLEQHLGVQLFDRSGAHITLTPAGAVLLKYADKIEKMETAAVEALSHFAGGHRGELRIGASLTIAQYILPHLLGAFQQQHPLVRLYVTTCNTEQVLEALVAQVVSVGFVEGPTLRRDVRTEVFQEDEIVLMVPPAHEWSERGIIDPEELKHERLLMRERGSGTRRVVEMALQKRGVKTKHLHFGMEFDSTEGIITAVEAGLGIGFASLWSISKELQVGSLRVVPIRGVRITRPLSVAYPLGQEPQGIALAFINFVRSRRNVMIRPRSKI
ncbi:MAG: LysR substrate-binding domain-containing protein [Acidobacteriota bacterium]|nr:LysR substrate-binding domain-containing protein [Acidobacteriota bacterium]